MRRPLISAGSITLGILAVVGGSARLDAQNIIAADPQDAVSEGKMFHLPPGFEAQLVAAEPDIHKPINIAFDDKGRLWVTDTVEYPFPVAQGQPSRDTVKILEDFGADGRARKITTFADNLNIPVGVLPQRGADGHDSALVYSIPGIWRFTDTTGAGKADVRKLVLAGQTHDDTHGMTGSFNEGFDGWTYAVHGYRNTSTLKATDGSEITMTSGHTYRFRPDVSHIEINTHGQVNPFGMCFDPLGNIFTSDCETMPVLLCLRGAYYPSFGRPHDGLGFGPDMTNHMYGSSAIAGMLDYVAPNFPAEYQNMLLVGNVVTAKINRANLAPSGSGFHADDAPDFLVSDDRWFRPVCIKLGPDGAIYVADFYNRIIGHYEVDLHHPGRDRQRGRIWRIVYTGKDAPHADPKPFDLTKASTAELIADLSNANMAIRMLAMNYLADVKGAAIIEPLKQALAVSPPPLLKVHGMWVLSRLNALEPAALKAYATDADRAVRVHAMRVIAERGAWTPEERNLAVAGLSDADPVVQRCAADAVGRHPQLENIRPLLDARQKAPGDDPHLVHTLRMALRDQLNHERIALELPQPGWSDRDLESLVDVAEGTTVPAATAFLVKQIQHVTSDGNKLPDIVRHVARYGTDSDADELAGLLKARFAGDEGIQGTLFKALNEGVLQRQGKLGERIRAWGGELAGRALSATPGDPFGGWSRQTLDGTAPAKETWSVEERPCADGKSGPFFSSLPRGETGTGIIRSKEFDIPAQITFYMAGHNGLPPSSAPIKNMIQLKAVDGNGVLAESAPPRNDTAQKVIWDLSAFAGKKGYIEATDGDDGTAYAWLAFGRFEPGVVSVPTVVDHHRRQSAIEIAAALKITQLEPQVAAVLALRDVDIDSRIAAAKALPELSGERDPSRPELLAVLVDTAAPDALREACAVAMQRDTSPAAVAAFVEAIRTAPQKLQLSLAKSLAATPAGAEALLDAVTAGKASPRLLQDSNLRERLKVSKAPHVDERLAALAANLPAADVTLQNLINDRAKQFTPAKSSAERGQKVFTQNCVVCHSVGGQGAHVGPPLDGIGIRGVPRICEDILDPSRNVDGTFRYNTYVLLDGNVIAAIPRHEEGHTLTVADATGKEIQIQKSNVKRVVPSNLSLMPSNFGEVIKPDDFNDLMAYLLAQTK